ncbi:MAG: hypothetical protein ACO4CI_04880, partial [Phycisphaerales bacterium]
MSSGSADEALRRIAVRRLRTGCDEAAEDDLVVEAPLEIRIEAAATDGQIERRSIVVLRTPGQDAEL